MSMPLTYMIALQNTKSIGLKNLLSTQNISPSKFIFPKDDRQNF